MSIQVANWTYAECVDGMLMILLSTLELEFLFQPFLQQTHRKYIRRFCITVYTVYSVYTLYRIFKNGFNWSKNKVDQEETEQL